MKNCQNYPVRIRGGMSLVWYRKDTDEIFESAWLDVYFFNLLGGIKWELVEVLGEL